MATHQHVKGVQTVISRETFKGAMELAQSWCEEHNINKNPDYVRSTINDEFYSYKTGNFEVMLRRSFDGYWVELFCKGDVVRYIEVK